MPIKTKTFYALSGILMNAMSCCLDTWTSKNGFWAWNNQWNLLSTLITMWYFFSAHSISDPYLSKDEDSTCETDQILSPNHYALSSWPTVLSVRNFPLQGQQLQHNSVYFLTNFTASPATLSTVSRFKNILTFSALIILHIQ